ncbi:helix-turn-helix domain-containing protein [Tatlockia micdadei]|uniref:LexA family protein n=1 Tax=Legionella micdadei TaxID=451 RepID=UPI0015700745|nr:helix-turn-helix domain-containing protein [Legionella micdadei]NSL19602.1 helix-turn-helix domain-containing protein [Legionella micdadei]
MTISTLSSNLKQLMRTHGNLSVSELARLTNIPQPTIHHMLYGSTKNPRKKTLEALSNYFSVSIEQLIGEEELPQVIPENIKEDLQLRTIPIIEWDTLKHWPNDKDKIKYSKEILLEKRIAPDSFAVIVKNSSMEPLFPLNTLLIFDVGKVPQDRDFVIAYIEENNNILFNRLFTENNELYLKQNLEDGNFKLIKLRKTIDKIIGVLIEARIQY